MTSTGLLHREAGSLIFPTDMAEANEICVDLVTRKIDFVLRFNAAEIFIRILTPNIQLSK